MSVFIIIVLAIGILYYFNIKRGKRFVRSVVFLMEHELGIKNGLSEKDAIDKANHMALLIIFGKDSDPDKDRHAIEVAKLYADDFHEGKQLPVIAEARSKGFLG